VYVYRLYCVQ